MTSLDQATTVKLLLSEGWEIVPAADKLVLSAPTIMKRTNADGSVARIAVVPDGDWKASP